MIDALFVAQSENASSYLRGSEEQMFSNGLIPIPDEFADWKVCRKLRLRLSLMPVTQMREGIALIRVRVDGMSGPEISRQRFSLAVHHVSILDVSISLGDGHLVHSSRSQLGRHIDKDGDVVETDDGKVPIVAAPQRLVVTAQWDDNNANKVITLAKYKLERMA